MGEKEVREEKRKEWVKRGGRERRKEERKRRGEEER